MPVHTSVTDWVAVLNILEPQVDILVTTWTNQFQILLGSWENHVPIDVIVLLTHVVALENILDPHMPMSVIVCVSHAHIAPGKLANQFPILSIHIGTLLVKYV